MSEAPGSSYESIPGGVGGSNTESLLERNADFDIVNLSLDAQFVQITSEFTMLENSTMDPRLYSFKHSLSNPTKNRYINVMANDSTVFPSKESSPPLYINGNLVDMSVAPIFVACQAPTPANIADFLLTLYHHNISLILMLTSCVENNMAKADVYWPSDDDAVAAPGEAVKMGSVEVWKDPEDPYGYNEDLRLMRRSFFIKPSNLTVAHKVVQFQYVDWPDHGVPRSTQPFEELLDIITEYRAQSDGDRAMEGDVVAAPPAPVVVHCSAGIGRTGTLIGAYAALQMLEAGGVSKHFMRDLVLNMRRARFGMVQRVEQYMFMYQIVFTKLGLDVAAFAETLQKKADAFQMRLMMSRQVQQQQR